MSGTGKTDPVAELFEKERRRRQLAAAACGVMSGPTEIIRSNVAPIAASSPEALFREVRRDARTCNRAAGHAGPHRLYDNDASVKAEWDASGKPWSTPAVRRMLTEGVDA